MFPRRSKGEPIKCCCELRAHARKLGPVPPNPARLWRGTVMIAYARLDGATNSIPIPGYWEIEHSDLVPYVWGKIATNVPGAK